MFVLPSEITSVCPHAMIREPLKGFSEYGGFY